MQRSDTPDTAQQIVVNVGLELLGAFALWWSGRWLIGLANHYWQVWHDTTRVIREAFAGAGHAAPAQHEVQPSAPACAARKRTA
jgi:hypothetical protein